MIIDPKWGVRPLPFDEFRPGQEERIDDIYDRFDAGAKIVFFQAPTGVGKSIIGEGVRRRIGGRSIYACSTKPLQDQFVSDFDYGSLLKGRSNYLTLSGPLDKFGRKSPNGSNEITAADCTYTKDTGCRWCPSRVGCPYFRARGRAEQAELAVLNTSYFLTSVNKGGNRFFQERDLVIIDEADLIENELINQVELYISKSRMRKMGITPPKRKTIESTWPDWLEKETIPKVKRYLDSLPKPFDGVANPVDIKEYGRVKDLYERMVSVLPGLREGGWVYDGYNRDEIIFRPIRIEEFGQEYLWPHAKKFLLMSATILSPDRFADSLGVTDTWDFVDVEDSPFPLENRPIYVVPVADMAYRYKDEEWPKMAEAVIGVIQRHPVERILVHCVSYELAQYLHSAVSSAVAIRSLHVYTNAKDRDQALKEYKSADNSVIFAASMDRGIDLPGDLCRVQVIVKVPFGNLKDKRINARMHITGGNTWYKMNAIRTLIQMTGRGVRSADDYAVSYILDKQFVSNIMASKYLLPKWWKKALKMDMSPRKLMKHSV